MFSLLCPSRTAVDSLGNALLVLLVVLYLLAEHSTQSPGRFGRVRQRRSSAPAFTGSFGLLQLAGQGGFPNPAIRRHQDGDLSTARLARLHRHGEAGEVDAACLPWLTRCCVQGYFLNVRMSHLFAVAHFLLNYVPTVRAMGGCLGCRRLSFRIAFSSCDRRLAPLLLPSCLFRSSFLTQTSPLRQKLLRSQVWS